MKTRLALLFSIVFSVLNISAEIPKDAIQFVYNNHLYIQASLQDTIPVSMIYDTGASNIYLDKDFIQLSKFGYNLNNKAKAILSGAGNGGDTQYSMIVEPLKITMGTTKYKDEYTPIINLREILGRHVDGMFGNGAFVNKSVIVNYEEGYIRPVKKLQHSDIEGFTQIPAKFHGKRVCLEAELQVDSAQTVKGYFLLDLGCGASIVLTNKLRESLNLTGKNTAKSYTSNYGLGGDGSSVIFRANSFTMLDELENVVVSGSFSQKGALAEKERYVGIVGNPILCHYDLIIDFANQKLYARRNNNTDSDYYISSTEQMSYVDRTDICDGWIVISIYHNGIAKQAGFEIGDEILSINGRPVKEISWEEQRKGLGLTGPTTYEVKKKSGEIVTYILNIEKEII